MIKTDEVDLEAMEYGTHIYQITASGFYNGSKTLEFTINREKQEIEADKMHSFLWLATYIHKKDYLER